MSKKDKETTKDGLVKGEGLVLVVDDEPIMRKIALNVLGNSGYDVITAENGEEAIKRFKQRQKDIKLVVLDLLMPDKSGKETYRELKQIQPDVKVLLMSGTKEDERVEELLKIGVKGFIEKPYTFPQLSLTVYDMIYKKK